MEMRRAQANQSAVSMSNRYSPVVIDLPRNRDHDRVEHLADCVCRLVGR